MTFRLAVRSLFARPVRSAVLSGGFGLGIAVMASLLGIGDVILEQARSPELAGGGDLLITGAAGFTGRHLTRRLLLPQPRLPQRRPPPCLQSRRHHCLPL